MQVKGVQHGTIVFYQFQMIFSRQYFIIGSRFRPYHCPFKTKFSLYFSSFLFNDKPYAHINLQLESIPGHDKTHYKSNAVFFTYKQFLLGSSVFILRNFIPSNSKKIHREWDLCKIRQRSRHLRVFR